jgi:hypothetical protein
MKGNVETKLSSRLTAVRNATVIRFHDKPSYRDHDVNISVRRPLELFEIKKYRGQLRAEVTSATHAPKTCHVIIERRNFSIIVGYTGQFSAGLEEA